MATASLQTHNLDYYSSRLFHGSPLAFEQNDPSLADEALPTFPSRYAGERVWVGSEMALKQDQWVTIMSEQDQAHFLEALRHFQRKLYNNKTPSQGSRMTGLNLGPESLSPKTFPLPQELSNRLRNISHDCYNGRGFGVLRGLHTEILTDEERILVFAGVSSHVAPKRGFQDIKREMVTCKS